MSINFGELDRMKKEHERFKKDWEYQQASIRMSNPEFFGVTVEEAKRYKKILEEKESELYHPDPIDDIVADVEYRDISDIVEEWDRHEEEMRQEIQAIEDMALYNS